MAQNEANGASQGNKARAAKTAANASFGMNMPLMSSAFDTSMWLDAA